MPNTHELVDIRNVRVDKSLPRTERLVEFIRQIKDPYHFRCGKFEITARFPDDAPSPEERLQGIIS